VAKHKGEGRNYLVRVAGVCLKAEFKGRTTATGNVCVCEWQAGSRGGGGYVWMDSGVEGWVASGGNDACGGAIFRIFSVCV